MRKLATCVVVFVVGALSACSSGNGSSTTTATTASGTSLGKTATCAEWSGATDADRFATANINLRFIRGVNAQLNNSTAGPPTRDQVQQLDDATTAHCGADQTTEDVLTAQETLVTSSPADQYLS